MVISPLPGKGRASQENPGVIAMQKSVLTVDRFEIPYMALQTRPPTITGAFSTRVRKSASVPRPLASTARGCSRSHANYVVASAC